MSAVALLWLVASFGGLVSAQTVGLVIDADPAFVDVAERLSQLDGDALDDIAASVGLTEAGETIHVRLASEDSDWGAQVPPWTAGFALTGSGAVVLFPARAPVYPHGSIEDVLRHEVAHVLIGRAAAFRAVPRWFHEGLATRLERTWRLGDQGRLAYELAWSPRLSADEIDELFAGDQRAQTRAYALATALVRDLVERQGSRLPREVLARVGRDVPFDRAFAEVTGRSPGAAVADFWDRHRVWTTWIPYATSTTVLWMVVTGLALLAIRRHRQKSAALRQRWDAEEAERGAAERVRQRAEPEAAVDPDVTVH